MTSLPSLEVDAHDVERQRTLVNQFGGKSFDPEEGSLNRSFDCGIIASFADMVTGGKLKNTTDSLLPFFLVPTTEQYLID